MCCERKWLRGGGATEAALRYSYEGDRVNLHKYNLSFPNYKPGSDVYGVDLNDFLLEQLLVARREDAFCFFSSHVEQGFCESVLLFLKYC